MGSPSSGSLKEYPFSNKKVKSHEQKTDTKPFNISWDLPLLGCDYHSDSFYLGRKEAKLLGDVKLRDIDAVKEFLDQGGNVNLQDEPA